MNKNRIDWLQYINNKLNFFENEKRFLIANLISSISVVSYLIKLFIDVLFDQISFNTEGYKKIIFIFSITISIIFFYRIIFIYHIYNYNYRQYLLGSLNIFKGYKPEKIVEWTCILSFLIILIYGIIDYLLSYHLILSDRSYHLIPLEILNSIFFYFLLIIWGYETTNFILSQRIYEMPIEESLKKIDTYLFLLFWIINELDKSKKKVLMRLMTNLNIYHKYLIIIVHEILPTISIIWIFFKLYFLYGVGTTYPYELIKIQIEFGLILVTLLSLYIIWLKPSYIRLIEIIKKINNLEKRREDIESKSNFLG